MNDASAVVDAILGGWQMSGIFNAWSGERINLRYTPDATFLVSGITQDFRGANDYRPNVIGESARAEDERSITNYFNKANVVVPTDPSQPFGNAKRNGVQRTRSTRSTSRWRRTSRFRGGSQTPAAAEAFNLLNRTNFNAPNRNRSSAAFGTITSTDDARQMQLGVKLLF